MGVFAQSFLERFQVAALRIDRIVRIEDIAAVAPILPSLIGELGYASGTRVRSRIDAPVALSFKLCRDHTRADIRCLPGLAKILVYLFRCVGQVGHSAVVVVGGGEPHHTRTQEQRGGNNLPMRQRPSGHLREDVLAGCGLE